MTAKKIPARKPYPANLDERKAFILSTVVYEYVATAEPVGSQTLTQKYNLGVSSATIRNEMAELEAAGYLVQPHTSAGRVPSDAGYRTYVDRLMEPETLPNDETKRIRDEFRAASRELEGVIEQTTRLVGRALAQLRFHGRAVARNADVSPRPTDLAIRPWRTRRDRDERRRRDAEPFRAWSDVTTDDLTRLSNRLNAEFANTPMRDLDARRIVVTVRDAGFSEEIAHAVESAFHGAIRSQEPVIASSGTQHLLDQPEFQDLRKLRSILRIIEEQKRLYELVADSMNDEGATAKIGHELGSDEITECSVVTVPYNFGDETVGVLAILGPRRMPYARLMALAEGTAQSLNRHFTEADR